MTFTALELTSEHACFGGEQRFYRHASREIGLPMQFSVYLPPQALSGQPSIGNCATRRCAAIRQ